MHPPRRAHRIPPWICELLWLSTLIGLPDESEPSEGEGIIDDRLVMQERSDGGGILAGDHDGDVRRGAIAGLP